MSNIVGIYNVTDEKYKHLSKNIKLLKTKQPLPTDNVRVMIRQNLNVSNMDDVYNPYEKEPEVYSIVYVIEGATHTKNLVSLCNECGMSYEDIQELLNYSEYNNGLYVFYHSVTYAKIGIRQLFDHMIKHGYDKVFK